MTRREPTYDLSAIQEKVRLGEYRITRVAAEGAADLWLDEPEILECVCELTERNFFKTMESNTMPGFWHDVYTCRYSSRAVYVKLQLKDSKAWVISFKQDESA